MTSCPSSGGVTIATEASPGYLSNTLYAAYSSLGWYSCPWIIHAQPGQRIQLTLITLQASHVEFLQLKTMNRVKLRHRVCGHDYDRRFVGITRHNALS